MLIKLLFALDIYILQKIEEALGWNQMDPLMQYMIAIGGLSFIGQAIAIWAKEDNKK